MRNNKVLLVLYRSLFLISLPLITMIGTALNRYRGDVHILKTFVDNIIPFSKIFIVPYAIWFPFFIGILLYFAVVDGKSYFGLLASIVLGNLICFVIYYFYPTTVPRPDVVGSDIFSMMVQTTYSWDNPFNCFPSIHVLNATLASAFLCRYNKKFSVRAFAIITAVLISLSTLYVKQHYLPDAILASIIGGILYLVFTNDYIWNMYPFRRLGYYLIPSRVDNDYIKFD